MTKDKGEDTANGVTITASTSGATIHLKWALIAILVGGGGLFGGRLVLPNYSECATGAEMKKVIAEHCVQQAKTESAQREQMVELKTKLENMSQDVRDIKQMLMRTQRGVGYSPQASSPDS